MRLLHSWEVKDLINLVERKLPSLHEDLDDEQIIATHENLRKNLKYYTSNFITFNPVHEPRSIYINLRIRDNLHVLLEGKNICIV